MKTRNPAVVVALLAWRHRPGAAAGDRWGEPPEPDGEEDGEYFDDDEVFDDDEDFFLFSYLLLLFFLVLLIDEIEIPQGLFKSLTQGHLWILEAPL